MSKDNIKKLNIPCLCGKVGDWTYYCGLVKFSDIAHRVKLPEEIDKKYEDKNLQLGEWIQRDLDKKRTKRIVDYLKKQKQRFFNSLILGLFDGNPYFQEINLSNKKENYFEEDQLEYLSTSIGILTLTGEESIFAIDGQHRAIGIREAVKANKELFLNDEIPVIFVAHKTTEEGKVRTRRLFSTLNRYAKPVNKSEIIALSEDNNCAVLTRNIIDEFDLFNGKIMISGNRQISPDDKIHFTNIITLYDIIERITTTKKVYSIKVSGEDFEKFTNQRADDNNIIAHQSKLNKLFKETLTAIPSFNDFVKKGKIDRKNNLIFRPIGQNILFDVIKVASEHNKKSKAISFFSKDKFNLNNKVWKKLFWDEEGSNIITEKKRQRFATYLILEKIGINVDKTKKDIEMEQNFKINLNDI